MKKKDKKIAFEDFMFDTTYNDEVVESERKYLVLIIYDIIDNKKRVKFAKYLQSYGHRVQKSSFEAKLNKKQYNKLISGIQTRINEEDNVRIYKITGNGDVKTWGEVEDEEDDDVIYI